MKPIIPKVEEGKGLVPIKRGGGRMPIIPKVEEGRGLVPFEGER